MIFQQDCETIPDLPRDSRQTTPAQSGGESSVEPSPVASRRKLSPKEKRQQDRDRFLTFTKEQEMEEKEEMEATLTQSRVDRLDDKAGFRQSARALDDERFRTRTITKDELPSPSSSPEKQTSASSSPSSRSSNSKQRRADEASRFLTQTIGPGDLVRREEEEESLTAAALESEALRVVASLSELKGRSRSQSAEILGESEMHDSREELCRTREASRELESRDSSRGGRIGSFDRSKSPADGEGSMEKARPRVCKPWESRVQEQEVGSLWKDTKT